MRRKWVRKLLQSKLYIFFRIWILMMVFILLSKLINSQLNFLNILFKSQSIIRRDIGRVASNVTTKRAKKSSRELRSKTYVLCFQTYFSSVFILIPLWILFNADCYSNVSCSLLSCVLNVEQRSRYSGVYRYFLKKICVKYLKKYTMRIMKFEKGIKVHGKS